MPLDSYMITLSHYHNWDDGIRISREAISKLSHGFLIWLMKLGYLKQNNDDRRWYATLIATEWAQEHGYLNHESQPDMRLFNYQSTLFNIYVADHSKKRWIDEHNRYDTEPYTYGANFSKIFEFMNIKHGYRSKTHECLIFNVLPILQAVIHPYLSMVESTAIEGTDYIIRKVS